MTSDFKATVIYCDGACSGNPGPGGWGAIIARPDGRVVELGGYEGSTTNNQMEMLGALLALREIRNEDSDVLICTDSTYVIRGITQWIFGWQRNQWKTAEGKDVLNKTIWQELARETRARQERSKLEWRYVRGHTGNPGNERVDEIAVSFSKGKPSRLFNGSLNNYKVPVYDIPEAEPLPEMKPKTEKKAAYSYLSEVAGTVARHKSWASCEARVKGRSGARFKKAMSQAEESQILIEWGAAQDRVQNLD